MVSIMRPYTTNKPPFPRRFPRYLLCEKICAAIEAPGGRIIGTLQDISANGAALISQSEIGGVVRQDQAGEIEFVVDGVLHKQRCRLVRVTASTKIYGVAFEGRLPSILLSRIIKTGTGGIEVLGDTIRVDSRMCLRSGGEILRMARKHGLKIDLSRVASIDGCAIGVAVNAAHESALARCHPNIRKVLHNQGLCRKCESVHCQGSAA